MSMVAEAVPVMVSQTKHVVLMWFFSTSHSRRWRWIASILHSWGKISWNAYEPRMHSVYYSEGTRGSRYILSHWNITVRMHVLHYNTCVIVLFCCRKYTQEQKVEYMIKWLVVHVVVVEMLEVHSECQALKCYMIFE